MTIGIKDIGNQCPFCIGQAAWVALFWCLLSVTILIAVTRGGFYLGWLITLITRFLGNSLMPGDARLLKRHP